MELTSTLHAGAAKIDITPPLGTIINGDFRAHYAHTIHDPLFSKAVVVHQKNVWMAIVVVDICVMPKFYVDQIRESIETQLEIPFAHILISSTHTHAAGSVAEAYLSNIDLGYSRKLPALIVESVRQAKANLRPAKIGFGKVDAPAHVRSRRYLMDDGYTPLNPVNGSKDGVKTNPFGAEKHILKAATVTDPELSYFGIQGLDGKWISVVANYSLHYVGDWENGTISADYFGEFSAHLAKELGADDNFVGVMSNGTSGDINIWEFIPKNNYPTAYFEKSALIGKDLASKVKSAMAEMNWEENPEISIAYQELDITCRKPTTEELVLAREIVSKSNFAELQIDDEGLKQIYAREQVLLNEYPDAIGFPVQVFKIGNCAFGGLGGEFFASTGLWLKANTTQQHYFTISMANGNCGYVPPAAAFEKGGYETWRSRTSYLEEQAATLIQEQVVRMINE